MKKRDGEVDGLLKKRKRGDERRGPLGTDVVHEQSEGKPRGHGQRTCEDEGRQTDGESEEGDGMKEGKKEGWMDGMKRDKER